MNTPDQPALSFNGTPVPVQPGQSVGAALMDAGIKSWRTTRKNSRPRGLFCGIGICYDCLVTVDGQPNQRACMIPACDGMQVTPDGSAVTDPDTDRSAAPGSQPNDTDRTEPEERS
jgi:predicted molibdopterin-dependent oxidoreductase YjgC